MFVRYTAPKPPRLIFVTEVLPLKLSDIRIDNALFALFE